MRRYAAGIAFLLLAAGTAQACSCSRVSKVAAFFTASDVFTGTVLSVGREGGSGIKGRVLVEQSWKGVPAGTVVSVYTSSGGSSCGVALPVGREIVIFARCESHGPWKGRLFTSLCDQPSGLSMLTVSDSLGPPASVRSKETGWAR